MSTQAHVSNIETAILDTEEFVTGWEDGPAKVEALARLANLHETARLHFVAFSAIHPEAAGGAQLRSGGDGAKD